MKKINLWLVMLLLTGSALPAYAQNVFVYPSKGQSPQQQDKDKYECYNWAKTNTGFDPNNPQAPIAASAPVQQRSGGVGRGLLGGALLGAAIGDSSHAAAGGALVGGLFAGIRRSEENKKAQQQQQQQQASQMAGQRNNFNRAYTACLKGRGYSVN